MLRVKDGSEGHWTVRGAGGRGAPMGKSHLERAAWAWRPVGRGPRCQAPPCRRGVSRGGLAEQGRYWSNGQVLAPALNSLCIPGRRDCDRPRSACWCLQLWGALHGRGPSYQQDWVPPAHQPHLLLPLWQKPPHSLAPSLSQSANLPRTIPCWLLL